MSLFFKKKKDTEEYKIPEVKRVYSFNKHFTVTGINTEKAKALTTKTSGFPFDYYTLKSIYDIGDVVYEYELHARKDRVSINISEDIVNVLVDGEIIGRVSKAGSAEIIQIINNYGVARLNLDLSFGHSQKVERNDWYDDENEEYDENDRKWITSDYSAKPKGNLIVGYDKPWS